jgi:hypothetical protein
LFGYIRETPVSTRDIESRPNTIAPQGKSNCLDFAVFLLPSRHQLTLADKKKITNLSTHTANEHALGKEVEVCMLVRFSEGLIASILSMRVHFKTLLLLAFPVFLAASLGFVLMFIS